MMNGGALRKKIEGEKVRGWEGEKIEVEKVRR
jgi:hypothetical protein